MSLDAALHFRGWFPGERRATTLPTTIDMLTTEEAAEQLGISSYYVRRLCRERGASFGAVKYGPAWVIPANRLEEIPVRAKGRPAKE